MTDRLKILVVAAHPDEAEEYASGTLSLLADQGHFIKVVTITNGDAGHFHLGPKALARVRATEAYEASKIIGLADYEIWDEHDGDLADTPALRKRMLRTVRQWRTDLIITFTDDEPGHNDNRLAGRLVRKALPVSVLPNRCRSVPPLPQLPVVLKMIDYGSVDRHRPDIAVDITSVLDRKLAACVAHASQFLGLTPEQSGLADSVPDPSDTDAAHQFVLEHWSQYIRTAENARPALHRVYGPRADSIEFAETFEVADFGRQLSVEDVDKLLQI
ncbi:MAG TPA: PIG-L deacetylase family protein [Microlunatus sp.]